MSTRTDHDGSYRRLFGHHTMVRALLEYVADEELWRALDLERMTRMETDFLSESRRRRESDAIWRVGEVPTSWCW